jgi:hypothetical protein
MSISAKMIDGGVNIVVIFFVILIIKLKIITLFCYFYSVITYIE